MSNEKNPTMPDSTATAPAPSDDPNKDTTPSQPQQVDPLVVPDLEGVPEDDSAEPEDAGGEHEASVEEVEAALAEAEKEEGN